MKKLMGVTEHSELAATVRQAEHLLGKAIMFSQEFLPKQDAAFRQLVRLHGAMLSVKCKLDSKFYRVAPLASKSPYYGPIERTEPA